MTAFKDLKSAQAGTLMVISNSNHTFQPVTRRLAADSNGLSFKFDKAFDDGKGCMIDEVFIGDGDGWDVSVAPAH